MKVDGVFEFGSVIVGGIAGLVVGYEMAHDTLEFARAAKETQDVLGYLLLNRPYVTYAASMVCVGTLGAHLSAIPGAIADDIFKTNFRDI